MVVMEEVLMENGTKLYMKQKVFSWVDEFTIKDAYGEDKYFVRGEFFSLGKKLHVYDRTGREVAMVHQQVFSLMPRFFVYVNGEQVAEVVKEFTFFYPKYRIEGPDWIIDGDFWDHVYDITCHGRTVVGVTKEWMTWGDCYELDIEHPKDEIMALAMVLCIDCVIEAQRD